MSSSAQSATYNPAYHRYTLFLATCTFLLIVAGALVTSNDAGLAVPDWPTSFGSFYKIPPMVGGVKYEHGHRMIAQLIGFLTILLAGSMQWGGNRRVRYLLVKVTSAAVAVSGIANLLFRPLPLPWNLFFILVVGAPLLFCVSTFMPWSESRPWMRKLGWFMLLLVIIQGVLGGLTVKMLLPWYVSTAHAMVAQTFFSLTILMTVFASRRWIESAPTLTRQPDSTAISFRNLAVLAMLAVYMQLFLGAGFRHGGLHFLPHLMGAGIATVILLWTSIRGMVSFANIKPIRGASIAILGLLVFQLLLGFGAYMTRVVWGKDAAQPEPSMVATTVAHVAVGALLLAHCFMLTVQAYRNLAPGTELAQANEQKAVPA